MPMHRTPTMLCGETPTGRGVLPWDARRYSFSVAYKWDCGTFQCQGVLRTETVRPDDDEIVVCESRPGKSYASSCHSAQRWDAGEERFMPYPEARETAPTDDMGELP